jgi:peptidoglycan hydrolase-like protein with peptidoglycan-binding domain
VKARLNNLGFKAGAVTATMDDQATSALNDFQRSVGMDPPWGLADAPTKKALLEAHGR